MISLFNKWATYTSLLSLLAIKTYPMQIAWENKKNVLRMRACFMPSSLSVTESKKCKQTVNYKKYI